MMWRKKGTKKVSPNICMKACVTLTGNYGGNVASSYRPQNFDLRRKIYGDECLGDRNLKMVEIGRKYGAACKFPGKAWFTRT
jgi:hypothetical protein